MLLKTSHFTTRPYRVNHVESNPDFIAFLETAEREILTSILGHQLWAAVTATGTLSAPLTSLRDGTEYEFNEITYKYYGLVDLLVPGALSEWVEAKNWTLTEMGYVEKAPLENNTLIDPAGHTATLWNDYVKKVGDCYAQVNKGMGTLYGFLKANEEDYPTWEFNLPEKENRWGM